MIVLDTTSKSITIVMSGAAATTNPSYTTAYADNNGTSFTEGASDGVLNGTTAVTAVSAPAASTRRIVNTITVENNDTAAVTITVGYLNTASTRVIAKVTLQVGDTWTTTGAYDTNGNLKQSMGIVNLATQVTGTLPIANGGTGLTSTPTNGQLDIGNGTGFTRAALTAGTGITVTNGAGSISIAATSTGTVTSIATNNGLTGGTITTSGTIGIDIYNGTTAAYTSYAIGTTIMGGGSAGGISSKNPNNSDPAWYAGTSDPTRFYSGSTTPSGGSALSGTWRYRGAAICNNVWLLTRTA
jgi:hypothetical protein